MKSIKNLIKVIMISGIVVMFNIGNVINCFASDEVLNVIPNENEITDKNISTIQDFCNKYGIINNNKVDNTPIFYIKNEIHDDKNNVIINYSNGSKYLCNIITNQYTFKPLESDKNIIFNNIDEVNICKNSYVSIKNNSESQLLRYSYNWLKTFDKHSNINYANNLQTNDDLTEYAKQWLKYNYNITLDVPIYYSNLNKDLNLNLNKFNLIGGLHNYDINNGKCTPKSIEIEEEYKKCDILSEKSLVHELCHYVLMKQGKQFDDGTEEFTKECMKNGGVANNGYRGNFTTHLGEYNLNNN